MNFDELYQNVPEEQREALRDFRAKHTPKTLSTAGTEWTYLKAGQDSNKVILWLVGGLKKADAAFQSIPILEQQFHIIAPDYPALSTMDALADGLAAILKAENVKNASVLSGSFGGMLAQIFVRRHPRKVAKLVLSTTTPPDKAQIERYQQLLEMVKFAPEDMLREQAAKQFFGIIAPPENEADFYRAYLKELFSFRMDKADIRSTYEAIIDYMQRDFSPDDLADWQGQMLIINSDNDATFGDEIQQSLYSFYPQARTHTFEGAGHSPGSTRRDEFFELVRKFFA